MKIIGVSGSPRKAATDYVVKEALAEIKKKYPEIETEYISFHGKNILPCIDCGHCKTKKDWCILKDDTNDIVKKLTEGDAFIYATPVYVMQPTPQMVSLFSRMRPLSYVLPGCLRNKMAVSIAVGGTRNGGQELAVNALNNMILTRGMNVVSNEHFGYHGGKVWSQDRKAEGAEDDVIGMDTVKKLALKLAENALIFEAGKEALKIQNR